MPSQPLQLHQGDAHQGPPLFLRPFVCVQWAEERCVFFSGGGRVGGGGEFSALLTLRSEYNELFHSLVM